VSHSNKLGYFSFSRAVSRCLILERFGFHRGKVGRNDANGGGASMKSDALGGWEGWRPILSCLLLLPCVTAAYGGWFSYDSYEDCMLGRMKGQNQTMFHTADKACKKQFGVEFDIYSVEWEVHGRQISITSDEYEIKSGEFSGSPKSCEEIKEKQKLFSFGKQEQDFGEHVKLRFVAGKARLPFEPEEIKCVRSHGFQGKYK
jgi:hypothetical protein